ncbi:hypothetical protein EK21DRAFT_117905 [Setomelanomma holmii]|uniref:Uncharacterized protein n=1 Tax=Setomelanomma holmii TaxID=210430 RepID=A0A9P4GZ15_9PLEO|nr:hypothetical protein EK21DRAFT_117905 [Setomelanomma holmii]
MVQKIGVDDEQLREAWHSNKLKEFLLFRGSQFPDSRMQADLRWLSQQTGFAANATGDFVGALVEAARGKLSPMDQTLPFDELEPLETRQAFLFYGHILNGFMPGVEEDLWLYLGFCTARDSADASSLAGAYRTVIDRCSFEEFWKAMHDSSMNALFEKYGLSTYLATAPSFKTLINNVARWHHSVWELKKFTLCTEIDPHRSVQVNYDFVNCKNARTHGTQSHGQLAPWLGSILGTLQIPESRLHNPYPLPPIPGVEYQRYDGVVAKQVVGGPASEYEAVCRLVEHDGHQAFVLPVPDDADEFMQNSLNSQASTVTGRLYVSNRVFEGRIFESLRVGR